MIYQQYIYILLVNIFKESIMKKISLKDLLFWLRKDKINFYLGLNLLFCIISLSVFIVNFFQHLFILNCIGWGFIFCQWIVIYLMHRLGKQRIKDREILEDVEKYNL